MRIPGLEDGDEADLRWFLGERDGLGLRSNFCPMVDRIQGLSSGTNMEFGISEALVVAATRARLISRALEQLRPDHLDTLWRAFAPPTNVNLFPTFGHLADLVVSTDYVIAAHRASRVKAPLPEWLANRVRSVDAQDLIYRAKLEASKRLALACRAYAVARDRSPQP